MLYEPILVEGIKCQVWGHKHVTFYGMQSCVPFEHSPWIYYSRKPTFLGHKDKDLEHLCSINNNG